MDLRHCPLLVCGRRQFIFQPFGITLPAFKIAGGIILLQIGIDMLQAKQSGQRTTPEETKEGTAKEDASIIPLGMPMLAGPGAISTVMVLVGESHTLVATRCRLWRDHRVFDCRIPSSGGSRSRRTLSWGKREFAFLMRLMGLLLVALAVQFVANGLIDFGLLKPPMPH